MSPCAWLACHDGPTGRERGKSRTREGNKGDLESMEQGSTGVGRLLTSHVSRRRFLAGITAAGLTPPVFAEAVGSNILQVKGDMNMVQQSPGAVSTSYLTVPGARLYYEVSGSGPVLLLIPGGPVDADGFATIISHLEDHYTVVRYDPRGISRSRLDGPAEDVPVSVHADDAQQLLLAIGNDPAYVLGSSGGAVIGLALAERHPEQLKTLVAHEPPLLELLPEGSELRTGNQAIYDTYLAEGAGPAMEMFAAVVGGGEEARPADLSPEEQEAMAQQMARMEQNIDFFFAHYLMPITTYRPDIGKLQAQESSTQVVVGVGEESGGQLANETALALAERLGTAAVIFPGDHMGMMMHPEAFTEKLDEVFRAS
jgi:pimeloyl-ACP methyl ester carboxylesterase